MKKRITSLALAAIMVTSTAASVFAAPVEFFSVDGKVHTALDVVADKGLQLDIVADRVNYTFKDDNGKTYNFDEIATIMNENPGMTYDDALEQIDGEEVELKVESVSAITRTGVEVKFEATTADDDAANVVVKDGKGNVVATEATLVAEGSTSAEFAFVTPFTDDKFETGVWTVNGVKFSFDAINQLADIKDAVEAGNQIELQAALDTAGITYDELKIADYLTSLADPQDPVIGLAADFTIDTLEDVQTVVNAVNKIAGDIEVDAAIVKAVVDAKTQAQLLTALKANFDHVNPAWIVQYADKDGYDDGLLAIEDDYTITVEAIQDIVYAVNLAEIDKVNLNPGKTLLLADTAAKQAKVTTLIEAWMEADDVEDETSTDKAEAVYNSKVAAAQLAITDAKTANAAYNALVSYANLIADEDTPELLSKDLVSANKSEYWKILEAGDARTDLVVVIQTVATDDKGIKTGIVDAGNDAAALGAKTTVLTNLNKVTAKTAAADAAALLAEYKALDKATVTAEVKTAYADAYKAEILLTYTAADPVVEIDAGKVQTLVNKVNLVEDAKALLVAVNKATTAETMSDALIALEAAQDPAETAFINLKPVEKLEVAQMVIATRDAIEAAGEAKAKEFATADAALKAFNTADTGAIALRTAFLGAVNAADDIAKMKTALVEDGLIKEIVEMKEPGLTNTATNVLQALEALKAEETPTEFKTIAAIKTAAGL